MLCFAVSMSSCSDKKGGSSNDSSASASDSTSASGSASGEEAVGNPSDANFDIVAYVNAATAKINNASSVQDLQTTFMDIDNTINTFRNAHPDYKPTPELQEALGNAEKAVMAKLNEYGIDIDTLLSSNGNEIVEAGEEYIQNGTDQVEAAFEEVAVPSDYDL